MRPRGALRKRLGLKSFWITSMRLGRRRKTTRRGLKTTATKDSSFRSTINCLVALSQTRGEQGEQMSEDRSNERHHSSHRGPIAKARKTVTVHIFLSKTLIENPRSIVLIRFVHPLDTCLSFCLLGQTAQVLSVRLPEISVPCPLSTLGRLRTLPHRICNF